MLHQNLGRKPFSNFTLRYLSSWSVFSSISSIYSIFHSINRSDIHTSFLHRHRITNKFPSNYRSISSKYIVDTGKIKLDSKFYFSKVHKLSSKANKMSYAPSFKEIYQNNLHENEKNDNVVDLLFAFDFDGVICNSARELCISGWEAGKQLYGESITNNWPEKPSNDFLVKFHQVRPVVETGWEAIIINRALMEGESVDKFLSDYSTTFREELIERYKDCSSSGNYSTVHKNEEERYKKAFHEARMYAIETNRKQWLEENDFYPEALEALRYLNDLQREQHIKNIQIKVVIITTKAKEFTLELLAGKGIDILESNVFGLGSGKKVDVLNTLLKEINEKNIEMGRQRSVQGYFIEDRLLTLKDVMKNQDVSSKIQLLLAGWGYNTEKDILEAKEQISPSSTLNYLVSNSSSRKEYPIYVLETESDLEEYIK